MKKSPFRLRRIELLVSREGFNAKFSIMTVIPSLGLELSLFACKTINDSGNRSHCLLFLVNGEVFGVYIDDIAVSFFIKGK
jgi:hypothetical protein